MDHFSDLILEPLKTEKSNRVEAQHKYCFKVRPTANKREIRSAIEKVFNVHVESVNTLWVQGKEKRVSSVG